MELEVISHLQTSNTVDHPVWSTRMDKILHMLFYGGTYPHHKKYKSLVDSHKWRKDLHKLYMSCLVLALKYLDIPHSICSLDWKRE